jgi:hypothetical protein
MQTLRTPQIVVKLLGIDPEIAAHLGEETFSQFFLAVLERRGLGA